MAKYILPFQETQQGWYEIEATTIEEAKKLAEDMDYMAELEPNYRHGTTDWDVEDIEAVETVPYIREEN